MRRALVTGGGTGIGRGIALALARRGYSVAIAGRRADRLAAAVSEIAAGGGQAVALPIDLSQPQAADDLVERTRHALGGSLDVLVNNAGVMLPGRLERLAPQALQQVMHVNLIAPILLTQAALSQLTASRGSVVFVASRAGLLPLPFAALYSASKAGLQAFGAALRYELEERGVHLLLAFPPATATAMTRALTAPAWAALSAAAPLRIGEQIVAALGRRESERHWLDYQTPLIWLHRLWPGLVHRLLRSQRAQFAALMNAGDKEDS